MDRREFRTVIDIECAAIRVDGNSKILAVKAGLQIGRRSGGPHSGQGFFDRRFYRTVISKNSIQQLGSIQQLVLLHIELAKGYIQVNATTVRNGFAEGVFCLCVVAGFFVLHCQLNGNCIIILRLFVCLIVEPTGDRMVALAFEITGAIQKHIPGEFFVIYK